MNIFIILLAILLDLTWLVFAILSVVYSIKNWRESKININLFLMVLSFILIIYVFNAPSSFLLNYLSESGAASLNPFIFFTIGEGLTIGYILLHIVVISAFQFFVYLKNWKTLYTLPIVGGIILMVSLYLTPNDMLNNLLGMGIAIAILIDAIRSRNGVEVGLSFIIWFTLACLPTTNILQELVFGIARPIFIFLVFLGLSGLLDELLFYSKEEEEKIKNTWITKMVVKK